MRDVIKAAPKSVAIEAKWEEKAQEAIEEAKKLAEQFKQSRETKLSTRGRKGKCQVHEHGTSSSYKKRSRVDIHKDVPHTSNRAEFPKNDQGGPKQRILKRKRKK